MATEWYYSHDGDRRGPVSEHEIKTLAADGRLRPDDLVWQAGMEAWTQAGKVPGLLPPPVAGAPPPLPNRARAWDMDGAYGPTPAQSEAQSKKIAAAICAILIGSFGIHKFILGNTTAGLIMLLVTLLTCGIGGLVMHVIGIAEGIIYLTKSDEDFYQTYIVDQKGWF
jgi:TM2 domain-containing membrane protein YozV